LPKCKKITLSCAASLEIRGIATITLDIAEHFRQRWVVALPQIG